jgi:hypothetical protein
VTGGSAGSTGGSGGTGGANGGKDFTSHNTSSNPSAPTTDSSGLSPHAATNVGTNVSGATSPPNNHNNLATAACNNTNLSINVNLNNLSLRSPVGAHQMHMMAPSNHNRHPAQQGIQIRRLYTKPRYADNEADNNAELAPPREDDRGRCYS